MPELTSLELGMEALKTGLVDDAIQHLEKATADSPGDFQGFNLLGVAYSQKKLYNRAVGVFIKANRLKPGVPSIHYNLGLAYQADGMTDQARDEFQTALGIDAGYQKAIDALKALDACELGNLAESCARHSEEPAVGYCAFCHLPMCAKCKTMLHGEAYCSKCAENQEGL